MVYDLLVNVEKSAKKAVTVSVVSGNTDRGTVDANGQPDTHTYPVGEQVILRAYPKPGFKINYWQDQNGRKLPSSWMEENMIKFYPYDNATITAVFAPSTVLTYNDWKFGYELINDKIFITNVDQQGSSDLDLTQANGLGKELMGISPATFPNMLGLTSLKLPASCTSLDNYLNTAEGDGTVSDQACKCVPSLGLTSTNLLRIRNRCELGTVEPASLGSGEIREFGDDFIEF